MRSEVVIVVDSKSRPGLAGVTCALQEWMAAVCLYFSPVTLYNGLAKDDRSRSARVACG